jgi:branched-chain amino acid transport system substrate-binding protein
VFIAGAGTPAALPQKTLKERGYKGKIYQTHGVANNDFLRVCGKDCEGTWLPAGPLLVAEQLPADNPVKNLLCVTPASMKKRTEQAQSLPLAGMPGMPDCCWKTQCQRR